MDEIFAEENINVTRTFVVKKDVADALDSITKDSQGNRIKGRRGLISKIVSNALIKELVYLGVMDESEMDKVEEY